MLSIDVSGLEKLQRELADAQRAFQALDGTIATLKFDPTDPKSVEEAIRQIEVAVDSETVAYRNNELVKKVAEEMKVAYRKNILEKSSIEQKGPSAWRRVRSLRGGLMGSTGSDRWSRRGHLRVLIAKVLTPATNKLGTRLRPR